MNIKLFTVCAAVSLITGSAMAQVAGAAGAVGSSAGQASTGVVAPPVDPTLPPGALPKTTMPRSELPAATLPQASTSMGASAETGVATNTAASATDLKLGATVSDSTGANAGVISKVTKDKTSGDTMVTLSAKGKTKTVPAASLSLSGGALTSSQTSADIWGPK